MPSAQEPLIRRTLALLKRIGRRRLIAFVAISLAVHVVVLVAVVPRSRWQSGATAMWNGIEARIAEVSRVTLGAAEPALEPPRAMSSLRPHAPKYTPMLPHPAAEAARPPEDARYVPSGQLTLRPAPLKPIEVAYPEQAARMGIVRARLALFIDEEGTVTDARVVDTGAPPEFGEAARSAFLQARFRAGEVDGVRVKSRMLVEVEFDDNRGGK
jgi:TonB family protein